MFFFKISVVALALSVSLPVFAADKIPMVLATVGTSSPRMMVTEGQLDEDRPGWFAELSFKAAHQCGVDLSFAFMPWARALEMVKTNNAAAAFNSSYKDERAVYGVYPMKDGQLDDARSSRYYAYYAYTAVDSTDQELIRNADVNGRKIVVERKASIISTLTKNGAQITEIGSYVKMLRLAARKRVDAAVGVGQNFDPILARDPSLAALVKKIEKPIEKKVGYVMFSKKYYEQHKDLVECFWNTSANLKKTDWFKEMRKTYQ